MSDSLVSMLMNQLGPGTIDQLSQQIGGDRQATSRAVAGAIPVLLGALNRNSQQAGGADALSRALDRDHDGSVLDDLGGFLSGGGGKVGDGILGHILGGQRGGVEQQLGAKSGLSMSQIAQLMSLLAPILMGAMGKLKKQGNLGAGDLAGMLANEDRRVGQSKDLGGLAGLLDQDGDGSVVDDLAKLGTGLLGGLFGGNKRA